MPALRRHGGHTLLELLLTSAIGIILFGVMLTAFLTLLKATDIMGVRTALTGDLRSALEYFGRDVEQAREAPLSCPPDGTYPVSATRVVLNIPGVGDCVVYQCEEGSCAAGDPGLLRRGLAPGAGGGPLLGPHVIARGVTALIFTPHQDAGVTDRIDIDLGLLRARGGFQAQSRIIARYRLRNQQ